MKEIAAIWEDINLLVPWEDNPRYNQAAIESVKKSIERYGFGAPIIARTADKMVIAGHTRLAAAKRLNLDKVPVRYLDLDPADAKMLALADNKLSEIAEWNEEVLQEVLQDLKAEGKDVDDLGFVFDEEDLEEFELDEDLTAEVMPEVKFSEYLDEMNNYIVLVFFLK
jgi:ParB family transcriptional regulator, chromosome partitioning protein